MKKKIMMSWSSKANKSLRTILKGKGISDISICSLSKNLCFERVQTEEEKREKDRKKQWRAGACFVQP